MKFYTSFVEERPVSLSEETRRFAYESLHFKYGRETEKTPNVKLSVTPGMTPIDKYDASIRLIAEQAPIRICDGERISGAATLGDATRHIIPVYTEGENKVWSISHLTVDFETVLKRGINGIRSDVIKSLQVHTDERKIRFLKSCIACLDAFDLWHGRYLSALKNLPGYTANYNALLRVPHKSARSFYEAVQSIWFTFAFIRLCGNWPGIGRLDYLLGTYLKHDLENGIITRDEAKEILAHFFIKGCEWIKGGDCGSGDAQHYQNIVLAGIDESGKEITNEVTFMILEIIEELGISDFPTTVRLNSKSSDTLKRKVAEVMRYGGGTLAVYNEDLILRSLTDFGYSLDEARKFANDGCWEVQVPGKTYFIYNPFDALQILQIETLCGYADDVEFHDFEGLVSAYENDLHKAVTKIICNAKGVLQNSSDSGKGLQWRERTPCTVVSLFEQGCIEKALSYSEGGPVYNVISPHIGGLPDVVNSLYAIKKLVFDEKKLTFSELMKILQDNWNENEPLRQYVSNHYRYFGNDNDEVDMIAKRLLTRFADFCAEESKGLPIRFPSGVSTFGRQIEWAPRRLATPFGRFANEVLSGNLSPTPGTDLNSATALIRSYCKCNLVRQTTGAALDVKLLSKNLEGDVGIDALVALFDGFLNLGGFFMQIDVTSAEILREAQLHPEQYPTMSVRVSGWNARFATLNREWQDMIIKQMEK